MAMLDTHKAFENLMAAGYSKEMAEALLDPLGESGETLATKADLRELAQETKADLNALQQTVQALQQAVNERATKADLNALEMRITIKVGAMLFAVVGLLVALELLRL